MLFTTTKVVILLSTIYHSWGNVNVALTKPATQSSTLGGNTADKAVNGQTNGFSHTKPDGLSKWWTVDLLARYSIESITLYNRPGFEDRLAKISILTSTVLSPVDPNPTHSDWTIRNYRDEAYDSSGTVLFDSPIRAQHVAVYMDNLDVPLTLVEVEVYGVADNLALNKPARQISNYSSAYLAGKAVNGNINDFSHTAEVDGSKWWTVDLQARYSIDSITVYNRQDGRQSRLAKIYILTSIVSAPANPHLPPGDWSQRDYREDAYGSSGTVSFDPPIEARHVAVYSVNFYEPLALAELQVYENYNHAFGKTASQSSRFGGNSRPDLAASKAVDGNFSTSSITNFNQPNNQWWKVDLVDRILLRQVTVYVGDGLCGSGNAEVDCSSRLSDVYFLTNYRDASAAPRTDGVADWSICYHSETALGDSYTVQCDTGYQNPVTRLFSIRTNNGISVELREVYVFGYELPELSGYIAITAEGITANSITIAFSQWNQQMTGGLPPPLYKIESSGGGSKTVDHNSGSQRLSATFDGLNAGQTYKFTVSCVIQGTDCIGATPSIDVSTLCAAPNKPETISQESALNRTESSRRRWRYTVTWAAPNNVNCGDELQYSHGLSGQNLSDPQPQRRATFHVDGNVQFVFSVKTVSTGGISDPTTFSGTSDVLKPQFRDGQVTVTGKSSTCVTVTWQSPAYPGGDITQYQYKCGSEGKQAVGAGIRSNNSCNHEPNTEVNCTVWATNSAGDGYIQNSGKTLCAAPEFMEDPTGTPSYDSATNKAVVTISVRNETIELNCNNLDRLRYSLDGSAFQSSPIFGGLEAVTAYVFTIRAVNDMLLATDTQITVATGETRPDGGPVITQNGTDQTCVLFEWTKPLIPNGDITEYRYKCTKKDTAFPEWNTTEGTSLTDCGYEAGNIVTCNIQASTSKGYGPSTTIDMKVTCANPSPPVFALSSTLEKSKPTVNLDINLQDSNPYCDSIIQYTIGIRHPNGSLVRNQTTTTGGSYILNNLHGFTNYTVTIEVVNNEGRRSESTQHILTNETHVPEEPGIQDESTDVECVSLTMSEPIKPNGVILSYTFYCTDRTIYYSTNSNQPQATLCGFPSATQIYCSVAAINSIGIGRPQNTSISTQLKITNLKKAQPTVPELPEQSTDLIVPITINPIEVENTKVSTYIVMLSNVEARKKRSDTNPCLECYIAAEIPANEVTEGYVFNVGDGEEYNGHVNKFLVEQSVYKLYLGIQVIVSEMSEPLVKYLDPIRITVGKLEDSNWIVGVIAGIEVLILLALGITLAVVIIKNRHRPPTNTRNNPADSIDLSEYMHPPVPQPSHYTGLRFGEVRESDPCLDCEYETVAGDTRPDEQYETVAADPSLPDHVYATC